MRLQRRSIACGIGASTLLFAGLLALLLRNPQQYTSSGDGTIVFEEAPPIARGGEDTPRAPTKTFRVRGTTLDGYGQPTLGTRTSLVRVPGSGDPVVHAEQAGDSFSFDGLPPGRYAVEVQTPGWGELRTEPFFLKRDLALTCQFECRSSVVGEIVVSTAALLRARAVALPGPSSLERESE